VARLLRNARFSASIVLQVYFEHSLCMACEWNLFNVRAPTSYISLFAGLPYCNSFSLQQVSRLKCCKNSASDHYLGGGSHKR
jgi:hypothetical protein